MSEIRAIDCAESEIATLEADLRAKGYLFTPKNSENDLQPMEYMKSSYMATRNPL